MNENYASMAAEWWSNLIRSSYPDTLIRELDSFKELLTKRIRFSYSLHGTLRISTCGREDGFLENIAYQVMLPVAIPRGYEMNILFNTVRIYNNSGILVESFG